MVATGDKTDTGPFRVAVGVLMAGYAVPGVLSCSIQTLRTLRPRLAPRRGKTAASCPKAASVQSGWRTEWPVPQSSKKAGASQ